MDDYANAKADFIITPVISRKIIKHSIKKDVLLIPGCFTPSDVNLAFQSELNWLKYFRLMR
jgi:2-dehydro-3-deoxyphosphogluconate aldolase/(4S)-4-hydroxy-2-oxoglutarate aldolase